MNWGCAPALVALRGSNRQLGVSAMASGKTVMVRIPGHNSDHRNVSEQPEAATNPVQRGGSNFEEDDAVRLI